jgi:hypothetical protein
LDLASVREYQAKYIRKVIDTVNDVDNVLYEVANEGGYKDWDGSGIREAKTKAAPDWPYCAWFGKQ